MLCHSEPVATVFAEAGVPCVIGVQSQLQIADYFARKFAQGFYNYIFDGRTVGEAFNLALVSAGDPDSFSCCCAHSHKSDCKWLQKAKQEGYHHAHLYHEPLCTMCPRKNENIHRMNCEWAQDFQSNFCPDADIDFETDTTKTCCCSAELPHNELLKFIMISKEKQKCESMILFGNLDQGKIQNCKFYSVIDQRFPEKRLVGRNKQLHDLFILLKGSSKVVKLEGPKGTGKTVLARQLANYLYARNHFRYKIAAIELSTISTVSGLLSKIFSEIGVINDLNSFCEAVRSKEVLYILDNCDSFIEHNRVEFSKSLRNLISSTKNVKFLIIITKSFDLELQEASLKLDTLLPTHAAKLLLLSTPIDKILPMKYRSVEVLKNAPLFKQTGVKISIQTLLWISQRLMQGYNFETVQKELLSTFQSGTTEEQSKILIEATLNQIQHENAEACKLIKMINTFEGGLSYLDLQEMVELGIISIEWIAILLNLVSYKSNAKHHEESEESSVLASDDNPSKNRPQKMKFKPGYYFWFKIAMTKEDYPLFEPIESVREVLYQKIDLDLLSYETIKFEYLTLLSLSLLQKLKKTNSYSEKVIENSAVSDYGIWKINPNNAVYIDFTHKILKIDYLNEEKSYSHSNELETVFKLHEKNFRSVFSLPILKALVTNQGSREKMTDLIEVLFFTIPTLFKIILGCSESTVSLTSEALNCLNELDLKEARIAMLKIKLHLLIIAITITQRNEAKQIEQIINSEIQLLEMSKRELKDDKLLQRIDFEIEISRAKFFHKAHKGRYKTSNMLTEEMSPQPSFKYLSHLDNQLENHCPKILKYLTDTEVEQAKLSLLIYDAYSEKAETLRNEEKVRDNLSEAIRAFNKYHCKKLELKAHLLMSMLYLRYLSLCSHDLLKMEFLRAYIEKKNTSGSPQILIKESTLLGKIRKYHLKQGALHLAQQV